MAYKQMGADPHGTSNRFYGEGAAVDTSKTLLPGFGSKSGVELTSSEATQLVQNSLPKNVSVVQTESANSLNAAITAEHRNYKPPDVLGSDAVTFITEQMGSDPNKRLGQGDQWPARTENHLSTG